MSRYECEALRVNDEMQCGRCGLTWGVKDDARPPCAPRIDKRAIPTRATTVAVQRLEGADRDFVGQVAKFKETAMQAIEQGFHKSQSGAGALLQLTPGQLEELRAALQAESPYAKACEMQYEALQEPAGRCANCGRGPGQAPCDWIECAALANISDVKYGCHSKPRPEAGAVTHMAQDGYNEAGTRFSRVPRWVPVRQVMSTDCKYDKSRADPRCAGCPWAAQS